MDDVKVVLLINNIILIGQLIEMDLESRCMLLNSYLEVLRNLGYLDTFDRYYQEIGFKTSSF